MSVMLLPVIATLDLLAERQRHCSDVIAQLSEKQRHRSDVI